MCAVCAHVCLCECVHVHECAHVRMHVCAHVLCVHACVWVCTCGYARMYACVCVHLCVCAYILEPQGQIAILEHLAPCEICSLSPTSLLRHIFWRQGREAKVTFWHKKLRAVTGPELGEGTHREEMGVGKLTYCTERRVMVSREDHLEKSGVVSRSDIQNT